MSLTYLCCLTALSCVFYLAAGLSRADDQPQPKTNPDSPLMLTGDWFDHPHRIDFDALPKLPTRHVVISDVTDAGGVNQHNYLIHHDGRFWAMWSDGPGIEDRVGQVVKYAISQDGLEWTEPKLLTGYPPESGPDSPHYNTRTDQGMRFIARGFWVRDGQLLALASLDEAAGFFGKSLKLLAYHWVEEDQTWRKLGIVHDNTINNFPPKRLPTGVWMMSRRPYDYKREGVTFLIGGIEALDQWTTHPVPPGPLAAEEPFWWVLPDGNLTALFRDNRNSGYLFRSFSTDGGRTWTRPVRTNFPDARSKFHGLRLSDGRYVLVSNTHPNRRDPLTLAISDDGLVFDRLFYLVGGQRNGVDYPMVMEHDGFLYIAHSGGKGGRKQSVELQRVRIADLDRVEMTPASPDPEDETDQGPGASSSRLPFTVAEHLLKIDTLTEAPGMQLATIYAPDAQRNDNTFNNHPQLIGFKNRLYATWQGCPVDEDSSESFVLYSTSADGLDWDEPRVMAAPVEGPLFRASSGWYSEGDVLYNLLHERDAAYPGKVKVERYRASRDGRTWSEIQTLIPDAMGSQNIVALPSGRLIWLGHGRQSAQRNDRYVTRVHYSDNGLAGPWRRAERLEAGFRGQVARMIEPSWYRRSDGMLVMVYRDLGGSGRVWAATSDDQGETWSEPVPTSIPDSNNMQCAGNLPDGTAYMVNTTGRDGRSPLVLWLSETGRHFDRAFVLRRGAVRPRYPGRHKDYGFSYPGATIWRGALYVAVAAAKEDINIIRVPLDRLLRVRR